MSITNIKDIRKARQAKVIIEDLEQSAYIMAMAIKALNFFNKYGPVQECISTLKMQQKVIQIGINKYKKLLEKPPTKE